MELRERRRRPGGRRAADLLSARARRQGRQEPAAPDLNVGGGRSVSLDERRRRVDDEVARLLALGATKLQAREERGEYFVNMHDPEGNEFDLQ